MSMARLKNRPRPATLLATLLLAALPLSGRAGPADAPDLPLRAQVIEALTGSPDRKSVV
mgnify:CR=1 FL=1